MLKSFFLAQLGSLALDLMYHEGEIFSMSRWLLLENKSHKNKGKMKQTCSPTKKKNETTNKKTTNQLTKKKATKNPQNPNHKPF